MAEWITTWTQAHANMKLISGKLQNRTVRTEIRCGMDAKALRLRFSNSEGKKPVTLLAATVNQVPLQFSGQESAVLHPGGSVCSDSVYCEVQNGDILSVSFAYQGEGVSGNQGIAPSSISVKGNYVRSEIMPLAEPSRVDRSQGIPPMLPLLSSVELYSEERPEVFVCFGDSITQQCRWTVPLEEALRNAGHHAVVLNKGIGGNQLLSDPKLPFMTMWGPAGVKRYRKDVLELAGTTALILAMGTNDIGMAMSKKDIRSCGGEALYATACRLAGEAKKLGMKTYIATITPRGGCTGYKDWQEAERLRFNELVRRGDEFDGVMDYDLATRAPDDPFIFNPACDSGDHLHPGAEGGKRIAEEALRVLTMQDKR